MQFKLLREICSFGNWLCSQYIETFSSIFPLWSSIFIFFLMNLHALIRYAHLLWILLYRSYQLLKIQLCVSQHLYYSDDLFFCTSKSFVGIDSICLLYSQKLMIFCGLIIGVFPFTVVTFLLSPSLLFGAWLLHTALPSSMLHYWDLLV